MLDIRLLNAEKCRVSEDWNYPDVISPFYRIYFVLDGEAFVFNNKTWHTIEPGHICLIPAFTRNSYSCKSFFEHIYIHLTIEPESEVPVVSKSGEIKKVKFSETDVSLAKRLLELNENKALPSYEPKTYNNYYDKNRIVSQFKNPRADLETQGILLQILSRFVSDEYRTPADSVPMNIKLVLRYIDQNLDKKITVADLADKICLSPDYFSKLFVKYVKRSPIEYINKKRIEKAQLLLITTFSSIKQIGYECGYENMAYFYRQFKKECSCTPQEFRKLHRRI
ncbi:MAG: helix-turn-helix domain-containing protein [Prolixibacteraceae bacterium]